MTPETIDKLKLLADNSEELVGLIMVKMREKAIDDGHKLSRVYKFSESWGQPRRYEQMSHCQNRQCLHEISIESNEKGEVRILSGNIAVKCPL